MNVFLIGIPGFISKNIVTINSFYDALCTECRVNNINGYFFRPMNVCKGMGLMTNIDYMNLKFGNFKTIYTEKRSL